MKRFGFILAFMLLAGCEPEENVFSGYVEGDYVYIAPSGAGVLADLFVERGQEVKKGDNLFSLDKTSIDAAHASALAEFDKAKAQWNDLRKGLRSEEIEVILEQQAQARAALDVADKEYRRAQALVSSGAVSQSDVDAKKSAFEAAEAKAAEISAQIKTAKLGGRRDALEAALAAVNIAKQKIIQVERQMEEIAPQSPADGRIEDTYYRAGEFVNAGVPVVSILPPENIKIRFFVPQAELPGFANGKKVSIRCDGCKQQIPAKITFIASQSEYTPPVIYSVESRQKLVFMVEAKPEKFDVVLRPGLPVDILVEMP